MRIGILAYLVCSLLTTGAVAQVAPQNLAKPPADAEHFVILSANARHGESWRWTAADGTRQVYERLNLRGQVWDYDFASTVGNDGMPNRIKISGISPQGDAAEEYVQSGEGYSWKSRIDAGSGRYSTPAYYLPFDYPVESISWFVETLLKQPDRSMALLPGGRATAEHLTSMEIGSGPLRREVHAWAVTGVEKSPFVVWTDNANKLFCYCWVLRWIPDAYADEVPKLIDAQTEALAVRTAQLAKSLPRVPSKPVAFTHVRLFDAENKRFLDDQTVIVKGTHITDVGPTARIKVPTGAERVDGKGKTLLPGLWDNHVHVIDDYTGLQELSLGVTSIRDPGNNDSATIDRRTRVQRGELLMPHVYASSLIDGAGPYTAQFANVARSEADAIAYVRKAKANGFGAIKIYSSFNAEWLPATIAEAKRLGLHVHGHLPHGMRPMDAIKAGYEEITHINWVIMQAMPDDIVDKSDGLDRFVGPARFAKDVDLDGPEISNLVETMADRGIYSDPTMVAFESAYVPENGELSSADAPFVGTISPALERYFRNGGLAVPEGVTRADFRASFLKLVQLLGKMHKAGVPIVAGTDQLGIELVHELEIYEEAGMTPAEALATATIVPARLQGLEQSTGSIAVGKVADLVLVEGDPSVRMADLRQTRLVMQDGRIMDADALRTAAGFSGRPK